ncbi:MAG TPA: DUF72 domain-containing protein [Dehalococcoidia bacterium]|nr:DUF72 domain-containing protein [Dehalococcoidia bacterium]
MSASIYIGASSWADKSLAGRFYPPDLKDTPARLAFYAGRFNLAEIDSTYYALPSRRNLESWAAAVPPAFRFDVKVFALLSQHPTPLSAISARFREALPPEAAAKPRVYYKDMPKEIIEEIWRVYRENLQPLRDAGTLGAVLIDFPPWFAPSEASRAYLAEAREHLPHDDVIVEFRSRAWVAGEAAAATFALLRDLACGFVCVDEPQGLKSSFPPLAAATARIAAVRFRGRNAKRWEEKGASMEDRLDWWYTDEQLSEWLPRVRALADEAEEVHLVFNTKKDDQGMVNAAAMQRLLGLP